MKTVTQIRARLGLTQTALAGLLGVVPSAVSQYERGEVVIHPRVAKVLVKVAHERGFPLTLDQLYGLVPIDGEEPKAAA